MLYQYDARIPRKRIVWADGFIPNRETVSGILDNLGIQFKPDPMSEDELFLRLFTYSLAEKIDKKTSKRISKSSDIRYDCFFMRPPDLDSLDIQMPDYLRLPIPVGREESEKYPRYRTIISVFDHFNSDRGQNSINKAIEECQFQIRKDYMTDKKPLEGYLDDLMDRVSSLYADPAPAVKLLLRNLRFGVWSGHSF